MNNFPKLAALHPLMRLGIALLTVTLLGGYVVSGIYMSWHYEKRDGVEGLTLDDIRGHYHGVSVPSPLIEALEADHPPELPDRERQILLDWLRNPSTLSQQFDNFDLGEDAPAEIIATSCISCHARSATGDDAYPRVPLEFFDDISPLAVSREISPVPTDILAMSQHTHAPVMAVILLVVALLAAMTRAPRGLIGLVVFVGGVGLLADMSAWWLSRLDDRWIFAIVGGGFAYAVGTGLAGLAVVIDCVIPSRGGTSGQPSDQTTRPV